MQVIRRLSVIQILSVEARDSALVAENITLKEILNVNTKIKLIFNKIINKMQILIGPKECGKTTILLHYVYEQISRISV